MKYHQFWAILCVVQLVGVLRGAEIVVIYPRTSEAGKPIVYPDALDSTFVFGHVSPPRGELRINGSVVPLTTNGAFLSFLPVRKAPATKVWELTLTEQGRAVASTAVPFQFASDLPSSPADTVPEVSLPRVLKISEENVHTRTVPGGSYHLFPAKGTLLLATGWQSGFFEFRLADHMTGFVERRFVSAEADSELAPAILGDGRHRATGDSSVCSFFITRSVPWSTGLSDDGRSVDVVLYDTRLATDRFRYARNGYLEDVSWRQDPGRVTLTLRFSAPVERGYDVALERDSVIIVTRAPFGSQERNLKNKVIVIDPGHGGAADGSIGPLGTREKDVTLRWALLLADELRRKHAIPVLTREADIDVSLYDRVAIARQHRADMLVSLHANALPDGVNPFTKHGTGTYFYHELSHAAADILHRHLLEASGLPDDGVWDANFAVIRSTAFPSVLLEAAYIMYPPEEELLRSEPYLRQLAKGVAKGLTEHFKRQP